MKIINTSYLFVLSVIACHSNTKVSPIPGIPLASRVAQASDTTLTEWTSGLNTKNPLAEITIISIKIKGVLIGTCVFGVVADSTLVSFPANMTDCGSYYRVWVARRQ